jgi:hypothetical protein
MEEWQEQEGVDSSAGSPEAGVVIAASSFEEENVNCKRTFPRRLLLG